MRRPLLFLRAAAVLSLALVHVALAQAPDPKAAEMTDRHWLQLVDTGQYAAAWKQEDAAAKKIVSEPNFIAALEAARAPLGALMSREPVAARVMNNLPGAPGGQYIVTHFKTSFADKAEAVETVAAKQQPDGTWKVDGYHIR